MADLRAPVEFGNEINNYLNHRTPRYFSRPRCYAGAIPGSLHTQQETSRNAPESYLFPSLRPLSLPSHSELNLHHNRVQSSIRRV
jgi:hypothetical protein